MRQGHGRYLSKSAAFAGRGQARPTSEMLLDQPHPEQRWTRDCLRVSALMDRCSSLRIFQSSAQRPCVQRKKFSFNVPHA